MRTIKSACVLAAAGLLLAVGTAQAQDSTTGAVRGQVRDKATGDNVIGATVVASGPALQGTQASITDETGSYYVSNLPPGIYQVVVYYADAQFSRTNVLIQLGKVAKVNIDINTQAAAGETIVIEGTAPLIDEQSTKHGSTITRDYTDNVPTGRTFGDVLGATAGSQGDYYGQSFGGSTSVENTYIIEGVNTTDPGYGLLTTNLPNEFIQETEIITGGYNAEYGRSTGGIINVITKSGGNEFHGSVFGYWTPGALSPEAKKIPRAATSIGREDNLDNSFDLGAEVGGPIVKDKLWFHAGINPSFQTSTVTRSVSTQVDMDQDGVADLDSNGFTILEPLTSTDRSESRQQYYYTGKLTGAVDPDNQGALTIMGSPYVNKYQFTVNGTESAGLFKDTRNIFDSSIKWTSKFFDNKTQVDAVVGYHFDDWQNAPGTDDGAGSQYRFERNKDQGAIGPFGTPVSARSLTEFQALEPGGVPSECDDASPSDPYPNIINCPAPNYRFGGVGYTESPVAKRYSGILSLTQRFQAAGHHVAKGGLDIEDQFFNDDRSYSGGTWFRERTAGHWQLRSYVQRVPMADGEPCDLNFDGVQQPDEYCSKIDPIAAATETRNIGAYMQDSWSILPNLTVNAGLRWERQRLMVADEIVGRIDPATGDPVPKTALAFKNNWAPRLGAIYDWTKEGRSRVYGHWGRFYESIPMDLQVRAYGGEILSIHSLTPDACTLGATSLTCTDDPNTTRFSDVSAGGGGELVAKGLKSQYMDELVLGQEYEVIPDLKVGAAYIRRNLGRAVEDVSTDGGNTYFVANPGESDSDAIADLRAKAMTETDPNRAALYSYEADLFERSSTIFDGAYRSYNAFELTAEKRFNKNFFVSASYTYSKLKGNYPGLFSPETTQLDPNLTSMYDLPELMSNRYGDLAADQPHQFKVDGFYTLKLDPSIGFFTFGGRVRATSGIPINTLGSGYVPGYNTGEVYVLPRGEAGRTGLYTRFDSHVAYGRDLNDKGMKLEAFIDIFNLFNQQPETSVDENYTFSELNPVVGGDTTDLQHAKQIGADGLPSNRAPDPNPNWKHTFTRQAPLSARFGLRLIF